VPPRGREHERAQVCDDVQAVWDLASSPSETWPNVSTAGATIHWFAAGVPYRSICRFITLQSLSQTMRSRDEGTFLRHVRQCASIRSMKFVASIVST